jgi:hypothetical protein
MFFVMTFSSKAQVMAAKQEWITIKSANLKCWECKERLDRYLVLENNAIFEKGLIQWRINLISGEIRLQYIPDRVTPDDIRAALNNSGFDADTEKASEEAYKKLPPICKRVEDGGGPQKGKPCHLPPIN